MPNFTLFELCVLANAVEKQRSLAKDEYVQRMQSLDRISRKLAQQIDSLKGEKHVEYRERGFYDDNRSLYDNFEEDVPHDE